jgi:hypothetical protein
MASADRQNVLLFIAEGAVAFSVGIPFGAVSGL